VDSTPLLHGAWLRVRIPYKPTTFFFFLQSRYRALKPKSQLWSFRVPFPLGKTFQLVPPLFSLLGTKKSPPPSQQEPCGQGLTYLPPDEDAAFLLSRDFSELPLLGRVPLLLLFLRPYLPLEIAILIPTTLLW